MVGAHAEGHNYYTIGICFSGDFSIAFPSDAQIDSAVELIRDLCNDYGIPIDRYHVVGHRELNQTDCPGQNLYTWLDEIVRRAQSDVPIQKIDYVGKPVHSIFDLAARYESNGDVAAVGKFYGLYQFNHTTVKKFIEWLKNYPDKDLANYGRVLDSAKNFDGQWQTIATVDPGHFSMLQEKFAEREFFGVACDLLAKENFHPDRHTLPMKAVTFARAIQHGVFGCVELFKRACTYPNLSYIDAPDFDKKFIADIYNYLIANPTFNRSDTKYFNALRERFIKEKEDALA